MHIPHRRVQTNFVAWKCLYFTQFITVFSRKKHLPEECTTTIPCNIIIYTHYIHTCNGWIVRKRTWFGQLFGCQNCKVILKNAANTFHKCEHKIINTVPLSLDRWMGTNLKVADRPGKGIVLEHPLLIQELACLAIGRWAVQAIVQTILQILSQTHRSWQSQTFDFFNDYLLNFLFNSLFISLLITF